MLFKLIQKGAIGMLGVLMLSIFLSLPVQAEETIYSYQKVKNVTRDDDPAGESTTVGFKGDRVHYLLFFQNKSPETQTVYVDDYLPQNLEYLSGSAQYYKYQQGQWRDLSNNGSFPITNYEQQLKPEEWVYYTFKTNIVDLPESNVALANHVKIKGKEGQVLDQNVTKILAPNFNLLAQDTLALSEDLSDNEQKLLEEEFAFIEASFQSYLNNPDLLEEIQSEQTEIITEDHLRWGILVLSFLVFTIILYSYVQKRS